MNSKILTPITIWQGFNDDLPLKDAVIKTIALNSYDLNYLYFSGRETKENRVRIYGLYAKQKTVSKGSILILPNVVDTIDYELVVHFANLGYNVLSVDLRGEDDSVSDYTKYPKDVSYANYKNSSRTFSHVDKTAKETCWYEWACVARYGVSFLKFKNPSHKICVLGNKYASNVLWQVASMDKRVDCAIFLYGAGWLAYKGLSKLEGNNIEINDERAKFLAGVEAQSYAQYVECPVLFLTSTNSSEFDSDRAIDTITRIKNQSDCYLNFITNAKNVLDLNSLNDCNLFLEKYVCESLTLKLCQPELEIDVDGEDVYYEVKVPNKTEIISMHIFTSFNDVNPTDRVWYNVLNCVENKSRSFVYKQRVFSVCNSIIAFAVIKYKNGFTVSTKYNFKKVEIETSSSVPSVVFSATKFPSNFIVENIKTKKIGNVFSSERLYNIVEGPLNILGICSENTITSYAIKKLAYKLNDDSFVKFDMYTAINDILTVTLRDDNNEFNFSCNVKGGNNWQNIFIPLTEFKTINGMPIKNFNDLYSVSISSQGKFIINNFILL